MPVYAELHDGRRLEFPDGTAPEVIQGTVRKMLAQAPAAAPIAQVPEQGMGESMLIAAGRGTDKIVQGVRQAYNWATGDQATLDKIAADEAEKDRLYKPIQEKFPVATGLAEMAPNVAAGFLTGGTSVAGAVAANALPALLSYGSAEERAKRAAVDGAFGGVGVKAGQAIARALKPAGVGAQTVSNTALEAAKRIGYEPTPAQITQNPGMAAFENYLLRSPGSSGAMQKIANANQTALNRAGAKAMGETADALDEGVFAAAQSRIGGEFDRLSQVTKPDLTGGFLTALAKVDADNLARGSFASEKVTKLVDKGLDLAAKNNLDGKAYKEIRTALSNEAQAAFKANDATVGQAYKALVSALDDAAKGSLSKADQQAWDAARKEWGAFKTLTKSNVAEGGNVSAARAAAAVRAQGPALRTGKASGELADVARVGEAFKGVPNPTSGQLTQQMLYGNPFTGVPLMLGNKAAAAAYLSPVGQRYFARGLLDVGSTGQALLNRGGSVLAVPAGRGLLGVE
jgi:uncharacterized protein YecT (DUF1311 family)